MVRNLVFFISFCSVVIFSCKKNKDPLLSIYSANLDMDVASLDLVNRQFIVIEDKRPFLNLETGKTYTVSEAITEHPNIDLVLFKGRDFLIPNSPNSISLISPDILNNNENGYHMPPPLGSDVPVTIPIYNIFEMYNWNIKKSISIKALESANTNNYIDYDAVKTKGDFESAIEKAKNLHSLPTEKIGRIVTNITANHYSSKLYLIQYFRNGSKVYSLFKITNLGTNSLSFEVKQL